VSSYRNVVGEAIECPEEPGDVEIRFRKESRLDVSDLDVVVEVRTKLRCPRSSPVSAGKHMAEVPFEAPRRPFLQGQHPFLPQLG
jgi:hypothetical protein